jgi:hypothetical protein
MRDERSDDGFALVGGKGECSDLVNGEKQWQRKINDHASTRLSISAQTT